jgi:hypothetical protein
VRNSLTRQHEQPYTDYPVTEDMRAPCELNQAGSQQHDDHEGPEDKCNLNLSAWNKPQDNKLRHSATLFLTFVVKTYFLFYIRLRLRQIDFIKLMVSR